MENVVITGYGILCPIGLGRDEVWASLQQGRSGVCRDEEMGQTGWPAPFGGIISDDQFDPKEWVKPRKSLKVMAREIQLAFAAGEQAWQASGLDESHVDPERMGVVFGAGLMYCGKDELADSYSKCLEDGRFVYDRWGEVGMREMFPLWMLKYLPNMSACHVGIRRDARGPTNSIASGDASSLLAVSEALGIINRGKADVMVVGASSSRMNMVDLLWRESAAVWRSGVDPARACRPFDADRAGSVCGEGAAVVMLENETHALRRGATPIARVASVVSRTEASATSHAPTGRAIQQAIAAAMDQAGLSPDDLACVNAHAGGSPLTDAIEAQAIHNVLGDVPVTAPKSYFGNSGASCGAVELAIALMGLENKTVPATLNYTTPDPECPVNVVTEPTLTTRRAVLSLNFNVVGQAVAAVLVAE